MEQRPFRGKDGRWYVDWRNEESQHLGQHVLPLPAEASEAAAVNAAWRLWHEKRAEAEARSRQLKLELDAGATFAQAVDGARARQKELLAPALAAGRIPAASETYRAGMWRRVRDDLGSRRLREFTPGPGGRSTLLEDYVGRMAATLAPVTRSNRLCVVRQALAFAWESGWIAAMPAIPSPTLPGEVMRTPKWRWLAERDFRTLYDRLWEDHDNPRHGLHKASWLWEGQRRSLRDRAVRLEYIARRKLYLSTGFYTGMHTINLDGLNDESFSPDFGTFLRVNTKSAVCVPPRTFTAPEALWRDVQTEIRRLGRFWNEAEEVGGGRWPTVARRLNDEAARLNLPRPLNPRVLRRSTAYHLGLLGWSPRDTAEYLGHVDTRMVDAVYRRLPERRARERLDWTDANLRAVLGGITARAAIFDFEDARKPRHEAPAPAPLTVVK